MKSRTCPATGVSALALATMVSLTASASAHQYFYPYKRGAERMDPDRQPQHIGPYRPPYVAPKGAKSGTWTDITATLPFTKGPWGSMLLTDGTAIVEDYCTNPEQWYKLTPDNKGSYTNGTWGKIAAMPSGYSPLFFAQQVLVDGRVIINGGEYNECSGDWTNKGALYDPVKDSWTSVTAPSGWSQIGDAESVVLPNGTYMLADCCSLTTGQAALASISGTTVKWTTGSTWGCSSGDPCMDEEGFTALPNGDILAVDVWNHTSTSDETWIYDPSTGQWTQGPNTASYLSDGTTFDLGPAVLRPDGNMIQFGDNGNNNLYNTSKDTWSVAAKFPLRGYDCADAPAALLPDGNVFVQASPGVFNNPSHFFEYSISAKTGKDKLTQVSDSEQAGSTSSFESTMLNLPSGQILWNNSQVTPNEVATYTPKGKAKNAWLPVVSSVNSSLIVGSTGNAISGTNFNGFSLGSSYGDDSQSATNFLIVRITNNSTGDVCFGRSYNFSTMGVWTSGTTNAVFDIPSGCETGASMLQVIVNGIASAGTTVTLS